MPHLQPFSEPCCALMAIPREKRLLCCWDAGTARGWAQGMLAAVQPVGMRRSEQLSTGLLLWPMAQAGCGGTEQNNTAIRDLKRPFPFAAARLAARVSLMGCPGAHPRTGTKGAHRSEAGTPDNALPPGLQFKLKLNQKTIFFSSPVF